MRSELTLCFRYPLDRPCSKGALGSLRITPSPPLSTIFWNTVSRCARSLHCSRGASSKKGAASFFLLNHSSIVNFNQFDKFVNARKGKKWGDMIDYPRLRNEFCIHLCDWEHHIPWIWILSNQFLSGPLDSIFSSIPETLHVQTCCRVLC